MKSFFKNLLVRSQSITQTDNVYLAKNLYYVGGSQALAILNGFVIYLLVARFVDPSLFGSYRYLLSIFEISAITTLTGMKVALMRSVVNGYDGSLEYSVAKRLRWGYLLGLPLLAGGAWYWAHGNTDLSYSLILMYLVGPPIYATSGYVSFLQGKQAFRALGITTILNELFLLAGMLVAIFFAHTAIFFFAAYALANLDNLIFYASAKKLRKNAEVDPAMMSHAVHQSKLDLLLNIASRVDSLIIFHFLGAIQLAMYVFAILTADQLKTMISIIYTIAGPKLAAHALADTLKTFWRKMLIMGALGVLAVVAYAAIAPYIYAVLFPKYISAVGYSQLYAASLVFTLPSLLGSYLLNVQDLKKEANAFNIANQTLLIAMLLVGGVFYGIWGIIWARLISAVLQLVIVVWILWRKQSTMRAIPAT